MIEALQWLVLGVCVVCALWRLPAAAKGRNVGLFWVFMLLTAAVALSLPAIYLPVDAALGGRNFANLVIRFAVYGVFFILAAKVAAAYQSPRSLRLVRGPIGVWALILVCVATVIPFLLSDLPVSRTGLDGYGAQPSVSVYVAAGRLYPAYAAACLIRPAAHAARTAVQGMQRAAAALICCSFSMVVLATVLQLAILRMHAPAVDVVLDAVTYGSIVFLAVGLALVWVAQRAHRRRTSEAAVRP